MVGGLQVPADLPWSGRVVYNVEGGRAGRLLPQQPLLDRAQERGSTFPLGDRPGLPGEKQSGGCETFLVVSWLRWIMKLHSAWSEGDILERCKVEQTHFAGVGNVGKY